jgi:hypothetical protein
MKVVAISVLAGDKKTCPRENDMKTTYPSAFDRRSRPRFEIRAPLTIVAKEREISAFTRDISNKGVSFNISTVDAPSVGQVLEFVIELPAEVTLSESCRIRCLGRVLRIVGTSWNEAGVATELFHYAFVSDDRQTETISKCG